MKTYDLVLLGHFCKDEIIAYGEKPIQIAGSAVLYGGIAAAVTTANVAVIAKMNPADNALLQPLKQAGVDIFVLSAAETTQAQVIYPTADIEERQARQIRSAGPIRIQELPRFRTRRLHLAGISNQEFDLPFIKKLKSMGYHLAIDMQAFVRQIHPQSNEIQFKDVAEKEKIISLMEQVKLDILEACILTGTDDLEKAAAIVASWGCKEVLITTSDGLFVRSEGKHTFCRFTHKNTRGRTGRGDTAFAAYLARRITHSAERSCAWAAALVSLKMEIPGPFTGSVQMIEEKLATASG